MTTTTVSVYMVYQLVSYQRTQSSVHRPQRNESPSSARLCSHNYVWPPTTAPATDTHLWAASMLQCYPGSSCLPACWWSRGWWFPESAGILWRCALENFRRWSCYITFLGSVCNYLYFYDCSSLTRSLTLSLIRTWHRTAYVDDIAQQQQFRVMILHREDHIRSYQIPGSYFTYNNCYNFVCLKIRF